MTKTHAIKIVSIFTLLLFASAVYARQISYSYVQGTYFSYTDSSLGFDINGNAIGASGSFALAKNFAVTAAYANVSYDRTFGVKLTGNGFSAGITAHTSIAPNVDLYGNFSAIHDEVTADNGITSASTSDTGNVVSVGMRALVNNNIELGLSGSHSDIFGSTTNTYEVDASYYVNEKVSIGVGYISSDNLTGYGVGVRFDLE